MKAFARSMVLVLAMGLMVGCSQRIGDFTVMSSKNFQTGQKYKKVGRHKGEDKKVWFIIPFGVPDLKNAVDKAIEAGKGVYLADVVLESYNGLFDFGYIVTGDVYAPATTGDLSDPTSDLYSLSIVDGTKVLTNGTNSVQISN